MEERFGPLFVGRAQERGELGNNFQKTRSGSARTILLHGESGVGKSELMRYFAKHQLEQVPELVILSGRCCEHESVPFKAIDGLIDSLTRTVGSRSRA